jgi:hypothetical protein
VSTEIIGPPTCAYCGNENPILVQVEAGMRLALQEAGIANVPDQVCDGCSLQLSKLVSKGAALRAEAQKKAQNRLALWRGRVALVKQAKSLMAAKNFSDSAVAYEKYIRALEIVYDKKPGELTPELFKLDARKQELTVVTSVYWDLMRIYDTHPRYLERQVKAAQKLAEFARFSPIFSHIVRKAEAQSRNARNPSAYKAFLKLSHTARPRCFIATAAFGADHPVVAALCEFRDGVLAKSRAGRGLVLAYYRVSPPIAAALDRVPALKLPARVALTALARALAPRSVDSAAHGDGRLAAGEALGAGPRLPAKRSDIDSRAASAENGTCKRQP